MPLGATFTGLRLIAIGVLRFQGASTVPWRPRCDREFSRIAELQGGTEIALNYRWNEAGLFAARKGGGGTATMVEAAAATAVEPSPEGPAGTRNVTSIPHGPRTLLERRETGCDIVPPEAAFCNFGG